MPIRAPWENTIKMTLFKYQMYLARTALIGDTFQIELGI